MKNPEITSEIFKIKKISNLKKIDDLIKTSNDIYNTYNKIMKNHSQISIIFINKLDQVIIHHLVLFCDHFNIKLCFISSLNEKIIGIGKNSTNIDKFIQLINLETQFFTY